MTKTPITLLSTPRVGGYPEHEDTRAIAASLEDMLETRCPFDAHFTGYASDLGHRLTNAVLDDPDMSARCNARMTSAVFDIDGPGHVATAEWRAGEQPKIAALLKAHPGGYVPTSRGGYRIVYRLHEVFPIRTRLDAACWRAQYLAWVRYLARVFGIIADPQCADWTRLFRAPFVVRDGVPTEPEVIGDASRVGVWAPTLTAHDLAVPAKDRGAQPSEVVAIPIGNEDGEYARIRIESAARYLLTAPLTIAGSGDAWSTIYTVSLNLIRRMRLPIDVAVRIFNAVYAPRLRAAGTTAWTHDELERRFETAANYGTTPPGNVVTEDEWLIMFGERKRNTG